MEQLFKEHYALLCLVSFKILKDSDAAKDAVQDFFLSYWTGKERISLTVSFRAYAIRAVKNLSLRSLENAQKEKLALQNLNFDNYEELPALNNSGKNRKLQELLNKLPEKRKNIFISFVVNGQSYSEIAENNGISVNTVKTQMKRAYDFLRTEATEDLLYFFLFVFSVFN